MAVKKTWQLFLHKVFVDLDHVRKGPQIPVLKENITMTHVTCFTLNLIWSSVGF